MTRIALILTLGATLLAACAPAHDSGATQLQLSAANKARQAGIRNVDPTRISPAAAARINALSFSGNSDERLRSRIRAALR